MHIKRNRQVSRTRALVVTLFGCWTGTRIFANGWLMGHREYYCGHHRRKYHHLYPTKKHGFFEDDTRQQSKANCNERSRSSIPVHRKVKGSQNLLVAVSTFVLASTVILSSIPCLASQPYYPLDYNEYSCPQSYASQSLGIQSVILTSGTSDDLALGTSSGLQESLKATLTPSICSANRDQTTSNEIMDENNSVRGIVYLPSRSMISNERKPSHRKDSLSLILNVRSSQNPSSSIALMGAKIPLSEIESFPISFTLNSQNFLMRDQKWEQSILEASDQLSVTAKICADDRGVINTKDCDSTPVFEGRGIARNILVPNNDFGEDKDDYRVIRSAASIRLSEASTPDSISLW